MGILKLKHLRHMYSVGFMMPRGRCLESNGDVMWNLQTITCIVLNKKTTYLIKRGSFPKLRKLGLFISSYLKGDVPKMLLSLQQLKHLNKLEIMFEGKILPYSRWNINNKPAEVLESLKDLSHLSTLKIIQACELVKCVVTFPPNITTLKLIYITCLNDDGMNAIGNLTKLRRLFLAGETWLLAYGVFEYQCSIFDLSCGEDGFPQLQEFHMKDLPIRSWKLGNGSMSRLQILHIDQCYKLNSLPSELWSLTTLTKVHVRNPSNGMAAMLHNLEVKNGREIIVE
ncbi:unnamed protein product [Lathyrus sativus]|nr:unnamed protein product [Lathyrus sativus]